MRFFIEDIASGGEMPRVREFCLRRRIDVAGRITKV